MGIRLSIAKNRLKHHAFLVSKAVVADIGKRYVALAFKDNGVGFEAEYASKIFTIFQRLHGLQTYSGTGIGLALIKKIAGNHQGLITAESEPSRGATFTVYLPT